MWCMSSVMRQSMLDGLRCVTEVLGYARSKSEAEKV